MLFKTTSLIALLATAVMVSARPSEVTPRDVVCINGQTCSKHQNGARTQLELNRAFAFPPRLAPLLTGTRARSVHATHPEPSARTAAPVAVQVVQNTDYLYFCSSRLLFGDQPAEWSRDENQGGS
ncbi:hypothetical protein B0H14DRAFT_2583977 [Mycena olivaceomarginata]|nr:hypothetical protein B0H14DRAFT_2583977 [Mycena olivaceomarginata]